MYIKLFTWNKKKLMMNKKMTTYLYFNISFLISPGLVSVDGRSTRYQTITLFVFSVTLGVNKTSC